MNDEELMNKGPVVEDDAVVKTTHKKADEDDRIEDIRVSDDVTPNFGYPTFNNSGPSETMGRIGWALTDIDDRLSKTSGGETTIKADDITDATDTGKALITATDADAAREAIGAGTSDFDGAYDSLTGIPSEFTPAHHTHEIADVNGLQDALDAKADQSDLEALSELVDGKGDASEITSQLDAINAALETKAEKADVDEALALKADSATVTEELSKKADEDAMTEALALKADAATVNEQLAAKADSATVTEELAKKANSEDVASQLALKADTATVTEQLAAKADAEALTTGLAGKLDATANAVSASKLETARTIALTGEVTGTASFDGTADVAIEASVADGVIPNASTLEGVTDTGRALMTAESASAAVATLGLSSVYDYKGQVASEIDLPEDAELGDVYNVSDTGMNYAWNGTQWDSLGTVTTLASLGVTATATELNYTAGVTSPIQTQLDAKQTKDDADAFETLVGETYATKTEMTDGLALKQDAATAFDGKYTSLTEVPSEFRPEHHTHVMADITDLDLSQFADYAIDTAHTIQIDSTFGTTAIGMKAGVYLVTEGDDTPAEIQEWKGSVGFEGTLTGYLHLFDYMPDGERHDHLALLMAAIRSADGSQYASAMFVYDGPQHKWKIQTSGMDQVRGLDAALALKADKTEIADMLTKTEAASTYQVAGDYATKGELAAKADATAIADMLTKTEAGDTYQPKGEYATTAQIADMETKTEAAEAYQPKGEYVTADAIADMETKTDAAAAYATKVELAAKQDAATAFDGKYTSLTEVPSQFTPAAHTHVIADVTGLQGALDAKADTSAIPTIPGNATTSQAGLMSAGDKTKLDGMTKMAFITDPAADTVSKTEFVALRDALVAAGYMAPQE